MIRAKTFRDRVSTVDEEGKRVWVFPKKPKGSLYRWRTFFSRIQLFILFAAPFIHINGRPLILLDIIHRKFIFFGYAFWPQDFLIFGVMIIFLLILIALITMVYGRVWCGWLCPQTILLEMFFRKIDYAIEGDSVAQQRLHTMPWNKEKVMKKSLKHGIYFVLSFLMGNIFLAYFIGREALWKLITDPPQKHLVGLSLMILFTLAFYWLYAYFREQLCCFLCPYARLQSVFLDKNSIGVIYDEPRGEPRSKRNQKNGDCIDCSLCQKVCPTGIDIRNGSPQLECIQCTACIDVCNHVMDKRGKERGLIRFASQNMIDTKTPFKLNARIISYTLVCVTLSLSILFLILTRKDIETTIIRNRGSVASIIDDKVLNVYHAKVVNKSTRDIQYELRLSGEGEIEVPGGVKMIAAESRGEMTFFAKILKSKMTSNKKTIQIEVVADGKVIETIPSSFLGR